jgi:hypothetical protein
MNIQPGEARALAHLGDLHPNETLVVSIALENGVGWLCVSVHMGPRRERHDYIVSPIGRVWTSIDGTPKGRLEPPIREPDLDHALTLPVDHPGHVSQLIDHLACLDEVQTEKVRVQLNQWKRAARERETQENRTTT